MPITLEQPRKQYHSTHSAVYSCHYHIVWCTKYRRPVLTEPIQQRLVELVMQQQDECGYLATDFETMPDHCHLLAEIGPDVAVAAVVGRIKGYTSRVLRSEFPELCSRLPTLWTRSKFVTSAGTVTLDVLKQYVEQQKGV